MPATLSDKIKHLRKEKEWSLDDLAREAGASKSYLWELENRPERKPSAEKLTNIAGALGVTTEYLLDENASFDDAQMKEAFFRQFNRLEEQDKRRVMDLIKTWGKR
jgi:transcriptional regulator with XRE-family HTH domain